MPRTKKKLSHHKTEKSLPDHLQRILSFRCSRNVLREIIDQVDISITSQNIGSLKWTGGQYCVRIKLIRKRSSDKSIYSVLFNFPVINRFHTTYGPSCMIPETDRATLCRGAMRRKEQKAACMEVVYSKRARRICGFSMVAVNLSEQFTPKVIVCMNKFGIEAS